MTSAFGVVHKGAAEEFRAARKARGIAARVHDPYHRALASSDHASHKAEGMYLRARRIVDPPKKRLP